MSWVTLHLKPSQSLETLSVLSLQGCLVPHFLRQIALPAAQLSRTLHLSVKSFAALLLLSASSPAIAATDPSASPRSLSPTLYHSLFLILNLICRFKHSLHYFLPSLSALQLLGHIPCATVDICTPKIRCCTGTTTTTREPLISDFV
jgi:hypothetical protein